MSMSRGFSKTQTRLLHMPRRSCKTSPSSLFTRTEVQEDLRRLQRPPAAGRRTLKMQFESDALSTRTEWQSRGPSERSARNSRSMRSRAINKTTLAVEALLDGEAETLTRKAIEACQSG